MLEVGLKTKGFTSSGATKLRKVTQRMMTLIFTIYARRNWKNSSQMKSKGTKRKTEMLTIKALN